MKTTHELAIKWFDALKNGRLDELYTYMADNILWENCQLIPGYNDIIPWLGSYHGKCEVKKTFEVRDSMSQTLTFSLDELYIDDDIIIAHECGTHKFKKNGEVYRSDVICRMKCKADKITEWKAYWDTSEAVCALKKKMIGNNSIPELLEAAGIGDLEKVRQLLLYGVDVNQRDDKAGASALHKACQGGRLEVIKCLLEHGVLLDATIASTGHTALIDAIWFKEVACCKYLLEHGASIGIHTNYGFSIDDHIQYAINVNQKPSELAKLEKIKGYVEERRQRDKALEEIELFQGVTQNDLEKVKSAIEAGANVESRYPIVNGFNDGHTPFIIACRENMLEIASYLLKKGADANAVEPVFGAVPLHKATYNGHPEILRLLLDVPEIDVNYQGYTNGYTPLHDALWHGFEVCSDMLLDYGVNLYLKGHDGKLPIDIARDVFGDGHRVTQRIADVMGISAECFN